jgi:hypothetical protein
MPIPDAPQITINRRIHGADRAARYAECVMANGSPSMTLDDSPVSGHLPPDRASAFALLFLVHGVNTRAKEIWRNIEGE